MKVVSVTNILDCGLRHTLLLSHFLLLFPQECSKRANSGRFSLRDLLMVPMQRVLKYHLLLQVCESVCACFTLSCLFCFIQQL